MRAFVLFALLIAAGCGPSGAKVKSYLKPPPNKPAFEKAVLGRSSREVVELLGKPHVSWEGRTIGMEYPIEPTKRSGVILYFEGDRVVAVDWGGN